MLTKVLFARLGKGGALLFFSVALGEDTPQGPQYGLVIRDVVLREKRDGTSKFVSFPSKQRTTRARAVVAGAEQDVLVPVVENGNAVYDPAVDLYFEGQGESRKATEAAWALRKQILDEALQVYERLSAGSAGRGVAHEAPPELARSTGGKRSRAMFDDDELPF